MLLDEDKEGCKFVASGIDGVGSEILKAVCLDKGIIIIYLFG